MRKVRILRNLTLSEQKITWQKWQKWQKIQIYAIYATFARANFKKEAK